MKRKSFSWNIYFTFQQAENAMRAHNINLFLDEGKRVFGKDSKDRWHEIDEAIDPIIDGIYCRMKDGKTIIIYGYNATKEKAKDFDEQNVISKVNDGAAT